MTWYLECGLSYPCYEGTITGAIAIIGSVLASLMLAGSGLLF